MKAPRDRSGDVCGKKSISNSKFYQAPQQFFLLILMLTIIFDSNRLTEIPDTDPHFRDWKPLPLRVVNSGIPLSGRYASILVGFAAEPSDQNKFFSIIFSMQIFFA
jgi:hypothetical protein